MEAIKKHLQEIILEPKREELINQLTNVVLGKEPSFVPYQTEPQYFEIWFDGPFEFAYVFLGKENFVIEIGSDDDQEKIERIYAPFGIEEEDQIDINRETEFDFFINCWKELESRLDKKVRCFLIEQGIIRGIDVNKSIKVEGDEIEEILAKENIDYP